jgi:AcrR family transcriptional regulator
MECQWDTMAPVPRMTRAESQAQTRAQLVKTARQLFFEDGYHPTSLEKVADAAGFSKGAVYSNFDDKEALFLALVDEEFALALERRGHREGLPNALSARTIFHPCDE